MVFKNIKIKPWIKIAFEIVFLIELVIFFVLSLNVLGIEFQFITTPALSDIAGIYFTQYILGILITTGITIFVSKYGSKIQLIYELTNFIGIIAIFPGLIYIAINFILEPVDIFYYYSIHLLYAVIISIVVVVILKKLSYRTIPRHDIEAMKALEKGQALLDIKDLKVHYPLLKGVLRKQIGVVKAVDGVSISIKAGETVGLVGESGCGKTTVASAILGLVKIKSGELLLKGEPLPKDYSRLIRKNIQIVFQDPDASLNPQLKVVDIIAEPLKNILGITNRIELRKHVLKLLDEVSLKKEHLDRYPHEFSGGQKQRLIIARALACNPELIILDEPTSALDVSVQAQILNLLRDLQRTYNYGFLFITHDLSVVHHIADRIAVMYLGKIVEMGSKKQIFSNPTHPYTKALLASRSEISEEDREITFVLSGEVPSPINPPTGCSFHPRCYTESYNELCTRDAPHKIEVEEGHYIWCVNEEVLRDTHDFIF